MIKPFIALLCVASAALAQKAPDPGFARLPGPVLKIRDSVRIDTRAAKLETPLTVFSGPRGGVVVYSQWRAVTAFDSLGRRQWSQGEKRGQREIAEVTAFGWDAAGQWVSDAAFGQIALLDQYGNVTKSVELPSWVRPTFSNRKSFPVFESMRVYGRYDDGTMLVMPRGDNFKLGSATDFDASQSYLLRINEDGIIQRVIAKFPSNVVRVKEGNSREFTFVNPLHPWTFRVSPDAKRTVVVSVDTSSRATDTVVVRALDARGDTVYVRKFAYPAMSLSDTQVDSIARGRWGNDTDYRERRSRHMPRRSPAVWDVSLDVDKSVWITLRGNAASRSVIGFDAAGNVIGKLQLPANRSVRAANLGALWVGEARSDMRGDLVKYRLVK